MQLAGVRMQLACKPLKLAAEPLKIVRKPTLIVSGPALIAPPSIKETRGRERATGTRVSATSGIVLIRDGVGIERDFKKGATP
jgi:hypothetical protein